MSQKHLDSTQKRRQVDIAFALLILGGLVALAAMAVWAQNLSRDLRISNEARDLLAQQVQALGEKPVAGPPGSRGEPGQSVVGPSGPPGRDGATGASGKPGKDGADGSDGDDGASVTGAPGASGAPGIAGPPGPQGEPGPAGADGSDGADGRDGTDGQICPDGYSLQAPSYDPDALVCRRDGAPDPGDSSPTPQAAALDPSRRIY